MDGVKVEVISGSNAYVIHAGELAHTHPKVNVEKIDIDVHANRVNVLSSKGIKHSYQWVTKVLC